METASFRGLRKGRPLLLVGNRDIKCERAAGRKPDDALLTGPDANRTDPT